jgi:hypothetical protein
MASLPWPFGIRGQRVAPMSLVPLQLYQLLQFAARFVGRPENKIALSFKGRHFFLIDRDWLRWIGGGYRNHAETAFQ